MTAKPEIGPAPNGNHIERTTSLDQLATALVKAQQQMRGAVKDSTNPFFKSKYADLGSVWDACREALTSNGLSVVQFPGFADGAATLTTVLLHSSGQWIQGTAGAPLKTPDAQGVGSALTYLRRYALAAVAGVVQEDDDGEGAVSRKPPRGPQSTPASAHTPPTAKELTEVPVPLRAPEEPLPFEQRPACVTADGEIERGESAPAEETLFVFRLALKAGITKQSFPA